MTSDWYLYRLGRYEDGEESAENMRLYALIELTDQLARIADSLGWIAAVAKQSKKEEATEC